MTTKQKEQLSQFEELGINIRRYTYQECVDILIHKYVEVSMGMEFDEESRFRYELNRVTKQLSN
jgi:aspartyl/asparaginyl-tRNA synthetase